MTATRYTTKPGTRVEAIRTQNFGTIKEVDRFGVLAEMDSRPGELLRLAWMHYGLSWRVVAAAV